ncbi:ankyrin repeat domain-containing protein [Planctomycetota bacterium]
MDIGRAKENGYAEIVELLSNRARQLKPKREIMTFCDYAAIGDMEKIKSLIAAGQDVNTMSRNGGLALLWASRMEHWEIAELLIRNGANVNFMFQNPKGWNRGLTPLFIASSHGKKDIVELLLANGAELNLMPSGDTALDIARRYGEHTGIREYTEIVELLQKHGAK